MKRIILALAVGCAVFGVVFAAAAVLNVNGGVTQAGSVTSLVCDSDGVTVEGYGVELDDLTGYSLKVSGIDGACAGYELGAQIQLVGGGKFNIVATIPAGGGTMTIPFPSPVPLADIIGVNLVIG
jgi:hypothetical protein